MNKDRKILVTRSIWLGAVLAPLGAPVAYMVFNMVFLPDVSPKHERSWETSLIALIFFFIPFSYISNFVFGIPLVYFLRRVGKLSFWWLSICSIPLGTIAIVCLLFIAIGFGATVQWDQVRLLEVIYFLFAGAVFGFVSAAIIYLIAGKKLASSWHRRKHRYVQNGGP